MACKFTNLNCLNGFVFVECSLLTRHVLDSIVMNIVDSNDVVGHIGIVVVIICHDSMRMQMISIDSRHNRLVKLPIVVVIAYICLNIAVIFNNVSIFDMGRLVQVERAQTIARVLIDGFDWHGYLCCQWNRMVINNFNWLG